MEWLDKVLRVNFGDTGHDPNSRPMIAALTGLGGSGKAQLMLRYAQTHLDDYGAIFWIDAKSEQTVRSSFNDIARLLHIGSATRINLNEGQESSALIRAVETDDVYTFKNWIRTRRRPWLLLFENLTDILLAKSITQLIPTESLAAGRILITSRRRLTRSSWKVRVLAGLDDKTAARNLLFHYLDSGEKVPLTAETDQADHIVEALGFFPLFLCLAGSYMNVVGSMDRYLSYYNKMKRELLRNILRGSGLEEHYPASVFTAWKATLDFLPESAQRLYYLFCSMDRTCISLDLLRRACSPKDRWGRNGELSVIAPGDTGVPSWLLTMCLTSSGEWNELALVEEIYRLESLFLVRRESLTGDWVYKGRVVKRFGTGQAAVLIKMEHCVQEIGVLMLEDERVGQYAAAAICTAVHLIENDAIQSVRLKENESSFDDYFVVVMPTGGMVNDVCRLMFTLEECFGHIRSACEGLPGVLDDLELRGSAESSNYRNIQLLCLASLCW